MSHASKPARPNAVPNDPNTGPPGRGLRGRTPGKGKYPVAGYGSDKMSGGVPGAFGDTTRSHGMPRGDEVTEETNTPADEPLAPPNSAGPSGG
jgi:hypothetical protein